MSEVQKLTKKQKKGLAFRDRKTGGGSTSSTTTPTTVTKKPTTKSGRRKDALAEMEDRAIPVMEEQDSAGGDGDSTQVAGDERKTDGKKGDDGGRVKAGSEQSRRERKGKGKGETGSLTVVEPVVNKKKRKKADEDEEGDEGDEEKKKADAEKPSKRTKVDQQRFLLFIGNLKYTTSEELIAAHFAKCDPPPQIRLLTPKPRPGVVQRPKSKGCAFLEFTHRNALQQALKLHHSMLDGRVINVELTAGGGGKSETRLTKVRERNKALNGQWEQQSEKEAKKTGTTPASIKPQRYSATSGIEQKPTVARTWSIPGEDDGQQRKRGKGKGKPQNFKALGTGVNAIPVG